MVIHAGGRLGPYEILAPIGAGGMGEEYEARDTRLVAGRSDARLYDGWNKIPEDG